MNFKFTLVIENVASKDEAIETINEMLDAYDFHVREVKENADDEIYINWPADQDDELLPTLDD